MRREKERDVDPYKEKRDHFSYYTNGPNLASNTTHSQLAERPSLALTATPRLVVLP